MSDASHVAEAQRKRNDYLRAFYGLVIDRPIRWATHQEVADAAGLDIEEGMTIGSLLGDRSLVRFRTMGGAGGSVELTGAGVREAERIIQEESSAVPTARHSPNSADEAREWVEGNAIVVEEAFKDFIASGTWPDVATLQRDLDRRGLSIDVQPVVDSKPRVHGEARLVHTERLTLRLRHLMWIEAARPLVELCVTAVRRAVAAYMSDVEEPSVTRDNLVAPTDRLSGLGDRLYDVLVHEGPSPFGGAQKRADGFFSIHVDSRFARTFRDVSTIEEFVARQDQIRERVTADLGGTVTSEAGLLWAEEWNPRESEATPEAQGSPVPWEPHQERPPQLFLSWSQPLSKRVSEAMVPVLGAHLPGVVVFFSPESIEPGDDPSHRLFDDGILESDALLVVVTAESANSAFVIWETAAAWARKKLVIPVFVDIAPTSVPGPLHTKAQGVHFRDRHDLDRAFTRLASYFGIDDAIPLSDSEFQSLQDSVDPEVHP